MKYTNAHNLPASLAEALRGDAYDLKNPPANIYSLTTLAKPPRMVQLERRHDADIEIDVVERGWTLFGSAIHYALGVRQTEKKESLSEERLYIDSTTWEIHTCPKGARAEYQSWYKPEHYYVSCKLDNYERERRGWLLQDYKVTSTWTAIYQPQGKPEWHAQLNIEAFALRKMGFDVDRLEDILILRDFSASKAKTDANYPRTQFFVINVPIWSDEKCMEYIDARLEAHVRDTEYADCDLGDCTPDDRWAKPDTYAVVKNGNKRAEIVCDSNDDAAAYMEVKHPFNTHHIEKRPGIDTRCVDYCNCNQFCDYWQKKYNTKGEVCSTPNQ